MLGSVEDQNTDPDPSNNPVVASEMSVTRRRKRVSATRTDSGYVAEDGETTEESDIDTKRAKANLDKLKTKKKNKFASFWRRFITTWTMIFGFFGIIYVGHIAVAALLCCVQILAFREVARLGTKPRVEMQLPNFYWLHWVLLGTTVFYLYGTLFFDFLVVGTVFRSLAPSVQWLVVRHDFISFCLICLDLVLFVVSLKPGFYRYQFKQLGWCLTTVIVVVILSSPALWNLFDGMIYTFLPAALIITNDIMAYMFGIFFGKTPLIQLSPNKTWEGAIGGGLSTVVIAVLFAAFLIDYQFFVCPKRGFDFEYPTCEVLPPFQRTPRDIPPRVASVLQMAGVPDYWLHDWMFADFQFHSMVFAVFASVIGPFGGFLASGFKRAFKIKDFGDSIPGHGGIIDRFDCQIFMCSFVFFYRKAFIVPVVMTQRQIWQRIMNLSLDDQKQLLSDLTTHLGMQ